MSLGQKMKNVSLNATLNLKKLAKNVKTDLRINGYFEKFSSDTPFSLDAELKNINVVICMYKDTYLGLVVDELFGQEDIDKKSMGILDNDNRFFSGATILEDAVALVLDVESLIA